MLQERGLEPVGKDSEQKVQLRGQSRGRERGENIRRKEGKEKAGDPRKRVGATHFS